MFFILMWSLLTVIPVVAAIVNHKMNRDRTLILVFSLIGLVTAIFQEPISRAGFQWAVVFALLLAGLAIGFLRWRAGMFFTVVAGLLLLVGWVVITYTEPLDWYVATATR